MSIGATELSRRYHEVVKSERARVLEGKLPWSPPCYYDTRIQDYDEFLCITINGKTYRPSDFIREGITILDIPGPAVFLDATDTRRFKGFYGITATDTDSLLEQRRKFHPDRILVTGNVFDESTWERIPDNIDLACARAGCGFDKNSIHTDGLYEDFSELPAISKSIYREFLKLLCNVYNKLNSNNGVLFASIPSEQLLYGEGIQNLNIYLQTALGANGISAFSGGSTRSQSDRLFIQKTPKSPITICADDICAINLLGCRCRAECNGCDLAGLKSKRQLKEVLRQRAKVRGFEPDFVSTRQFGANTTNVWVDPDTLEVHAQCIGRDGKMKGQI